MNTPNTAGVPWPEAKLVSFPGQKALYDHIWHHFVDNAPSPLMRVALG